jgi:alpha-ketoglutarate-dependent taurine dioxygenase
MENFKRAFINKEQLPLVIQPSQTCSSKTDFFDLLSSKKALFKEQLSKYGGILFRGFPAQNANDFAEAIRHLGLGRFVDYIGGDSPRKKINEGVYTSTEAPPSVKIPLHNELSFVKYYPKNIYFFCEIPPKEKGETIIADARKVYEAIDPAVKKRFTDKGLRYVSCYYHKSLVMDLLNKLQPCHKTWIQVFESDSKAAVELKCHEHEFEFKWAKNDWLQISQTRPAIMAHPETGEKVWFNQAHLYDFNPKLIGTWRYIGAKLFYCRKHTKLHQIFYADHQTIPRVDLYHVMDVLDSQTIAFPWQKGDLLVLDNVLAMHGRATFEGKRRILAAMTS